MLEVEEQELKRLLLHRVDHFIQCHPMEGMTAW
jgi:hypothetical protein